MGNVKDLMSMIPGMGKAMKNVELDDNAFIGIEAIIYSMTKEERTNPTILNGNRRKRIAVGSAAAYIFASRCFPGSDLETVKRRKPRI